MSQTPGSPDELAELRARFLAAIERGGPPVVLSPCPDKPLPPECRTPRWWLLWLWLRWPYDVRQLKKAGFRRTGWKSWETP